MQYSEIADNPNHLKKVDIIGSGYCLIAMIETPNAMHGSSKF